MAERKKDNVGTTGDGPGEGGANPSQAEQAATRERGNDAAGSRVDSGSTAKSPGSIASGGGDSDLSQASGGSVD